MRRIALLALLFSFATPVLSALDMSGKWTLHVKFFLGSGDPWFEFKQAGENLTGMYHGRFGDKPLVGTVKGDQVEFRVIDTGREATYTGTVAGDNFKGKAKYPSPVGTGHFEGSRNK